MDGAPMATIDLLSRAPKEGFCYSYNAHLEGGKV